MATRGPKPKPTAVKELAGNPGGRPLNEHEPNLGAALLACPGWMGEEAAAEWDRVAPLLFRAGVTTEADRALLAAYCRAYSQWVAACAEVDDEGAVRISPKTGQPYQSAHVNVEAMYAKEMRACAAELGMTPSSRSRIHAAPGESGEPLGKARFFKVAS